jgi:hypothetical protein
MEKVETPKSPTPSSRIRAKAAGAIGFSADFPETLTQAVFQENRHN